MVDRKEASTYEYPPRESAHTTEYRYPTDTLHLHPIDSEIEY